jgi:hypothetical protein
MIVHHQPFRYNNMKRITRVEKEERHNRDVCTRCRDLRSQYQTLGDIDNPTDANDWIAHSPIWMEKVLQQRLQIEPKQRDATITEMLQRMKRKEKN